MREYPRYYRNVLTTLALNALHLMKTAGVKNAVKSLPVEMAKEARQETVRII
jgi:hypothetical protein